jgi:hypothetical protein
MPTRKVFVALCALCILFGLALPVMAQDEELQLAVRRNFGYGGGSQIQGNFRMEVVDPPPLASVTFKIDETVVATVTEPPFRVDFETDDYPLGWHELTAVGQAPDGQTLNSNVRRFEFVSAEAGWAAARAIMIPLFSVVGVAILFGVGIQLWTSLSGGKSALPLGAPRKYGLLGGAICSKCSRPFSIHWWGFNAVGGKFDRCDHCGKWSFVRRASREKLAEAEAAELAMAQPETPVAEMSAEEKLRRQLDESRFDNH